MHRLRVEFGGKGQNLLARDVARSKRAEMAGRKVFEGQRHHRSRIRIGDWLWRSLNVAVICGNLNPSTRMARSLGASTAPALTLDLPEAIFGSSPVPSGTR